MSAMQVTGIERTRDVAGTAIRQEKLGAARMESIDFGVVGMVDDGFVRDGESRVGVGPAGAGANVRGLAVCIAEAAIGVQIGTASVFGNEPRLRSAINNVFYATCLAGHRLGHHADDVRIVFAAAGSVRVRP